jgi:hypothetical protein
VTAAGVRVHSLLLLTLAAAAGCDLTSPSTCYDDRAYAIGDSVEESIGGTDCEIAGTRRDIYRVTLAAATTVRLDVAASSLPTLVAITADGVPAGTADDNLVMVEGGVSSYSAHLALPAGAYTVQIIPQSAAGGAYTLESRALSAPLPAGCVENLTGRFYAMPGSLIQGQLSATDCAGAQVDTRADRYQVRMLATGSRLVSVSANFAGTVRILLDGVVQASQAVMPNGVTNLTFVPATTGYYTVEVTSSSTGSYLLVIQ